MSDFGPEYDPPKRGHHQTLLQTEFVEIVDELVGGEINDLIDGVRAKYAHSLGRCSTSFGVLNGALRSQRSIGMHRANPDLRRYVATVLRWARKHRVHCDWYLDRLHFRLALSARAELLYSNEVASIDAAFPIMQFLANYRHAKSNVEMLQDYVGVIKASFNHLGQKLDSLDITQTAATLDNELKRMSGRSIQSLEQQIKEDWKDEAASRWTYMLNLARRTNSYPTQIPINPHSFELTVRAWQPFSEDRRTYISLATNEFNLRLERYMDSLSKSAEDEYQGAKTVNQKKRHGLTPRHRLYILALYQVKALSPKACLNAIEQLFSEAGSEFTPMNEASVVKTVHSLSKQIGLPLRKSKTKRAK